MASSVSRKSSDMASEGLVEFHKQHETQAASETLGSLCRASDLRGRLNERIKETRLERHFGAIKLFS